MIDAVKVHQLPKLLEHPDDLRTATLRSIIQAAGAPVVVEDASTGERFIPTVRGREITLAPIAGS
jgi:hypothetical protein